MDFGLDNIV